MPPTCWTCWRGRELILLALTAIDTIPPREGLDRRGVSAIHSAREPESVWARLLFRPTTSIESPILVPVMRDCLAIVAVLLAAIAGCNGNPYVAPQTAYNPAAQPMAAQVQDIQRRMSELDANNSQLHAQLAQSRQESQVYKDQIALLQKQIRETASQLRDTQVARDEVEQRLNGVLASTRQRGGAIITANSSLTKALDVVSLPGLEVRQDQDTVRIEIPADQLFQPGTAQLHPTSYQLLDQVAAAVTRSYPKQIVGIEGHTDNAMVVGGAGATSHQLSTMQALQVFDQLANRNRLPAKQLFTVGHGANHPLASNATAAGRAKNRRLELVIYPETF